MVVVLGFVLVIETGFEVLELSFVEAVVTVGLAVVLELLFTAVVFGPDLESETVID